MSHRQGFGLEHPRCDAGQAVFLVVFLGVCGLDSFVFRFSTMFAGVVPVFVRLLLGILSFAAGIYLGAKSLAMVFGGADGKPKFINNGVYAWVRHPMYLGLCCFFWGSSLRQFHSFTVGVGWAFRLL
jgi:protein-S-isoprenylcysteine O-methyltransferase Ste14